MPRIAAHELNASEGNIDIYNGYDCLITHEIESALHHLKPQAGLIYAFERALQGPVLEMMQRGFLVNPAAREMGIQRTKEELKRLDYIIQTLANAVWDKGLNPNSGDQLRNFFYNHLSVTPITVMVKGELKTPMDRKVLDKIEIYFQARLIVNCIKLYRDLAKQLTVLETEVDKDWRMRTSYNIAGTTEGRFSSSKSLTGSGTNLQNISDSLRHMFIPDPGYKLCGIDLEQSDSRFVGFMCGVYFNDWTYLDAAESGDLHTAVARMVWPDLPWKGEPKHDRAIADRIFYRHLTYRDTCKRLGHGVNFLGKARTMSMETHIPVKLVITFMEKYFGAFPCILQWQQHTAQELQTKQQLTSVFGRTRDFFDRVNLDETLRKALAFLAASGTADCLNLGMWRIWKHMRNVQLLAQLHDAIYFQFKETENEIEVVTEALHYIKVELKHNGRTFIVPGDCKTGYNWGLKSETNPKGLTKVQGL